MAACGGGSSSSAFIAGTAAYGAPLASARVDVLDSTGKTTHTFADENGEYRVNVEGFRAPLLVTASAWSGDAMRTYRAISESAPTAGATERVNVTPLTDATVMMVSSDGLSASEFDDPSGKALAALGAGKLQAAQRQVKASIQSIAAESGAPDFDPLKTPFKADGKSPGDQILDSVRVEAEADGVRILPIPGLEESGSAQPVPAQVRTSSVSTLSPPITIDSLDFAGPWDLLRYPRIVELNDMLNNWKSAINACLALPPEKRVSVDGNGKPVALLGSCVALQSSSPASAVHPQYRANGYRFLEYWGHELRYQMPAGSTVEKPQAMGFYKYLKPGLPAMTPPVDPQFMVVRLAWSSPTARGSFFEVARRTGAKTWQVSGNRQAYDAEVSPLATRDEDASTRPFVPRSGPDAGKPVGFFSAHTSGLSLRFNPTGPNAERVYAVRVKGPGLPEAGVVLARSRVCSDAARMTFFSNNGSVPDKTFGSAIPLFSGTGSSTFTLSVAPTSGSRAGYTGQDFFNDYRGRNPDGTPSTSPGVRVANPPVDVKTIPLLAEYTFEVFKLPEPIGDPNSPDPVLLPTAPSERFTTRLLTRPVDPVVAAKLPWVSFDQISRQYINPAGPFSGELSSATLRWRAPRSASPVLSAYVLGTSFVPGQLDRGMIMDGQVSGPEARSITLLAANRKGGDGQMCPWGTLPGFSESSGVREIATVQTRADGLKFRNAVFHNPR